MKWFVHVDQSYYPSAHVVEAEFAEEAIRIAWAQNNGPGYPIPDSDWSFAVCPLEHVEFHGDPERIAEYEDIDNDSPPREPGTAWGGRRYRG